MQNKILSIKIGLVFLFVIIFVFGIIAFQPYDYGVCHAKEECFLKGWRHNIAEPMILSSIGSLVSIIFTFFISIKIFKKWLIYFFIWLIVDILWVMSADTTSDYFGLTPTKETASIYMGFILVYTSLIWFILSKMKWETWIKWFVGVITFIIAVVLTFALS